MYQIDGITSQELTYNELKTRSIRYAECLQAEGVQEGDVVGLCSENRMDFTCALFGTILLGATVAPLNLTYSECKSIDGSCFIYLFIGAFVQLRISDQR